MNQDTSLQDFTDTVKLLQSKAWQEGVRHGILNRDKADLKLILLFDPYTKTFDPNYREPIEIEETER